MSDRTIDPKAPPGDPASRIARPLIAVLRILAGAGLVAMIVMTIVDVIGRGLLGTPLSGVVDMVEFAMAWTTFLGFALAFAGGAHIGLEAVDGVVSERTLTVLRMMARIVSAAVMACMAWLGWTEFLDKLDWGDRTIDLNIPLTWYWAAVVTGFALSAVFVLFGITMRTGGEAEPGQ
ncbi:MAG: TRAP transporter small permease [Rhizobiaceae bacterium]|nr:TRAP transporter small permease [Rhizobiaceae bacterium]MCV0404961.1 TRAP transporter small permease [Rhizobiaceae bacterium]